MIHQLREPFLRHFRPKRIHRLYQLLAIMSNPRVGFLVSRFRVPSNCQNWGQTRLRSRQNCRGRLHLVKGPHTNPMPACSEQGRP